MRNLDEKAAEYTANLCNQTGIFSKGEIETAYVAGAIHHEQLQIYEIGSFGQALKSLKSGFLVTRQGWNSTGVFIFMRPADQLPIKYVVDDIKTLPSAVKQYYARDSSYRFGSQEEVTIKVKDYLCMKSGDGTIVSGWTPSQIDMISEDWMIFDF